MTDLRQQIIDSAIAEENGEPMRWTPKGLAEAIHELNWLKGQTHTCDLEEICGTLNSRLGRHSNKTERTEKPRGPKVEAKRIELKPENQFRIYHPAPVVAINRFGVVRWVADGRQHKAGQLIEPRAFQGKLTVRFRYQGEQVERLVGHMLETVGWLKRRAKKKSVAQ